MAAMRVGFRYECLRWLSSPLKNSLDGRVRLQVIRESGWSKEASSDGVGTTQARAAEGALGSGG